MTPDTWKLIASIGAVLITAVTGPIIWAVKAEVGKLRMELKLDMLEMEKRLKSDIADLKLDTLAMEKRLNERIDTRLVHR